MRYICAQPANDFYTWQVEVVINNFKKHGVNPNKIDILCAIDNNVVPENWRKLQNHYNTVRFFFYNDTRVDKSYVPSIYFNLMSNHMKANPDLTGQRLFLHDCDIIFTRPPEVDWAMSGKIWYLSNTNSYINYDYIQQKGNHIYEEMCDIVGIDKLIPKLLNSNSGGAQYITIGESFEFWDKIESDSVKLYSYFCNTEHLHIKKYEGDYSIQKWTAGMWSLLWNIWLKGYETKVDSRLDFGWSTDSISSVEKYFILHNAGVSENDVSLFYKANYINRLPYDDTLQIDENRASSYYWKEVQETGKRSILKNKIVPHSYHLGKKEAIDFIIKNTTRESKILDVGPGVGTYSDYLKPLGYNIDGLEIYSGYVDAYNLKEKYKNIYIGDIVNYDVSEYDFVIIGDVLEHLTIDDAKLVIDKCKACLVAVPYNYPQLGVDFIENGYHLVNPHEEHKQPDLTPQIVFQRYPQLSMIWSNDVYGYFSKI